MSFLGILSEVPKLNPTFVACFANVISNFSTLVVLDSVEKGLFISNDILENIFPIIGVRIKLLLEFSCFIKKRGGVYQGVVRQAVYLGDMIEYAVEVDGVSILGTETDPHIIELFPEGESVTVGFAEDTIQVLPAGKKAD